MESREDYFYPKVKILLIGFLFFFIFIFLLSMVVEIFDALTCIPNCSRKCHQIIGLLDKRLKAFENTRAQSFIYNTTK